MRTQLTQVTVNEKNIQVGKEYNFNSLFASRNGHAKSGNVIVLEICEVAQPHPYGKYAARVKYSNCYLDNSHWVGTNELS